jgi:hypothetical protein
MRTLLTLGALTLAAPASAESIVVLCEGTIPYGSDGTMVECETFGAVPLVSDGPDAAFAVTLTAPTTHCSDTAYRVFAETNLTYPLAMTRRLRPGESDTVDIGGEFAKGEQKLLIRAVGYVGDCNTGQIQSWGVAATPFVIPK